MPHHLVKKLSNPAILSSAFCPELICCVPRLLHCCVLATLPRMRSASSLNSLIHLEHEFQPRGAIHSQCLLWTGKTVAELLEAGYIRADIPDPEKEPRLHELVMKYQIHKCKRNICGGLGRDGKCTKGFPAEPSDQTYHQPGNPHTLIAALSKIFGSPLIMQNFC
jgi:hypothetical protein